MSDSTSPDSGRNLLGDSTSPYLRQHADNPVHWYPWGEEALRRAAEEDKPILLSVGYSACHWCHVMAHESFGNPKIAELMNRSFINIKVDREERPDLDSIYQKVVALMGNGGGWPLTVFLTPEQRPFYGGTYFPPDDRYGRTSFPRVLTTLARMWKEDRPEIDRQVDAFSEGFAELSRAIDQDRYTSDPRVWEDPQHLYATAKKLAARFDPQWGGIAGAPHFAPKFPNVPVLSLLALTADAARAGRLEDSSCEEALSFTLDRMWRGGIYDHLRGGFARYSVDRPWLTPHFEKMLYDNGLLLGLYAEASLRWPERPELFRVVEETATYLGEDMRSPEGLLYSATDADSEGEEGKYFVWTPEGLKAHLGEATAERFARCYGVSQAGNFENGHSILHLDAARTLEEIDELATARQTLLAARYRRIPPLRDEKVLTAWNALAISGMLRAAVAADLHGELALADRWCQWAESALDALWVLHRNSDGRLLRTSFAGKASLLAYLEDLAALSCAYFDLHHFTLAPVARARALELVEQIRRHHLREGGGFYFSADDGESLIERIESHEDSPIPSALAMSIEALARAGGQLDDRPEDTTHLQATLDRFRGAPAQGFAYAGLLRASRWLSPQTAFVHLKAKDPDAFRDWLPSLRRACLQRPFPIGLSFSPHDDAPQALLCRDRRCLPPIFERDPLLEELSS